MAFRRGVYMDFATFWSEVTNVFANIQWLDFVDIALTAAIIYFVIRFFSNRKAWALFAGVCVCTAIGVISFVLNLEATSLIFSNIFEVGIVLVVIIFQQEIRSALEKIGSGSLHGIMSLRERRRQNQVYISIIDNVCQAVAELSETRTGALIVMTRTTKLDDIIATGTVINADVSSLLLRNIFVNKAPLHDGAVIIDERRLAAAACVLPLTRNEDIDPELGTRHRAAIGISEISDALVIVVSEETGVISVAYDCKLYREYTPDSLKSLLHKKILIGRSKKTDI
jgi:diadenylate cyclase